MHPIPRAEHAMFYPSTAISWQQADGVSTLTHGLEMGMGTEPKFSLAHPTGRDGADVTLLRGS